MGEQWLTDLEYGSLDDELLITKMSDLLRGRGLVRVTGFPASARKLIGFLENLGTPLGYYGGGAGTHPDHAAIWRVAYDREASQRGETHASDGPLPVHSSQSLLEPRPRYFCMLMANPGWQDQKHGMNGESLLVPWSGALRLLHAAHPDDYPQMLQALLQPIPFPDGRSRSVAYEISPKRGPYDYGVRLKSDLFGHLRKVSPSGYATDVMARLTDASKRASRQVQLGAGDLVVVDNDRWGHGREAVTGRRQTSQGSWVVNPRELWSLTLA